MKKFILIAVIILIAIQANSQIRLGVKAGVNFSTINYDVKVAGGEIDNSYITSFHLGGLAEFRLMPKLFLQPGLELSGQGAKITEGTDEIKINIMYLKVPVNVVTKLNLGLGSLQLGAGPYYAYALSGKTKSGDEETDIEFGNDDGDGLKRTDFGINLLAGYELKSGLNFGLGYQLGLSNTSPDSYKDFYTTKNTGISVSVGYMFGLK